MTSELLYVRGAFVAFAPKGSKGLDKLPHIIPFRFNPESLSRSLSFQGAASSSVNGSAEVAKDDTAKKSETVSNDKSGSYKETFSLTLRFDVHERDQITRLLPPPVGIAPELAALELLMHPVEAELPAPSNDPLTAEALRPTVLLVWGPRVLPVRVASMQINETLHNALLYPTRAEVNVSLELLTSQHGNDVVRGALKYMRTKRQGLARLFHATAAAQGGGILPL